MSCRHISFLKLESIRGLPDVYLIKLSGCKSSILFTQVSLKPVGKSRSVHVFRIGLITEM